ncbi:MAG: ATP-dependent helicase [Phycisphaerae bacterium]|nr:ATP-dependent helicase [Phycisphaerae bacterium]
MSGVVRSYAQGLNAAQLRAVEHAGGPLIVLAGPGTGKTRVITHRMARLLEAGDGRGGSGVAPESLLALTFSVKAAAQMRARLSDLVGTDAAECVAIHTFHGFGRRLARRFADVLGMPLDQTLMDGAQRRRMLRALTVEHDLFRGLIGAGRWSAVDMASRLIEEMSHAAVSAADLTRFVGEWVEGRAGGSADEAERAARRERAGLLLDTARLAGFAAARRREAGLVTMEDYIDMAAWLLREHPGAAAVARSEYRHVVVDEFQDVNAGQVRLLEGLCPPASGPDLCVVGDDDQAIYMFRGADDLAFERFARAWPGASTVTLGVNYRSAPEVVRAAAAVIGRATRRFRPDKEIRAARPEEGGTGVAGVVECVELEDDRDDGDAIAAMILADRAAAPGAEQRDGLGPQTWSRYAVIARVHRELERVGAALELEGIPCVRLRSESMWQDRAVRDVLAWAELLLEPNATWAVSRALTRPPLGVGAARAASWERAYRAWVSRCAAGVEPTSGASTYLDWLRDLRGEEPEVARLWELVAEFREVMGSSSGPEVLWRIATRIGAAHSDLLPARARAVRVRSLVALLRLAQEREGRLEQPGDLRALHGYLRDLEEAGEEPGGTGASLGEVPEDRVDVSAGDGAESGEGVMLLTAHAAKGLEFDTVFVARVAPGPGFPKSGQEDGPLLPEGVSDRLGDPRAIKERRRAEERRLFYVACTRAARRLVLLAKKNKSPSKSEHFFEELVLGERGVVRVRSGADVLASPGGVGRVGPEREMSLLARGARAREVITAARARVRARAAAELDRVERAGGGSDGDVDEGAGVLRLCAAELAMLRHLERTGRVPEWAEREGLTEAGERIRSRLAGEEPAGVGSVIRPPRPPLELAYTKIKDYQRCPRCFAAKHLLGLAEAARVESSVGTIVHEALRRFVERWRRGDAEGWERPGLERLLADGREVMGRVLRGVDGGAAELPLELVERVRAQLRTYWERFHRPEAQVLEVEREVRFAYTCEGITHAFVAKMDRVDLDAAGDGGHVIIDYKTGQEGKLAAPEADDLQLGVYAMALEALYGAAALERARGEYWLLATGKVGRLPFAGMKMARVRKEIDGVIGGILAGEFPRRERTCSGVCEPLGE